MTDDREPPVLSQTNGTVRTVTLNRPASLNALNVPLLEGLASALRDGKDSGAVVLRGAGRAFCVGEDLKETLAPTTGSAEELRRSFDLLQDLTRAMTASAAPHVAAVRGYAVGGGAELALAADIVVAAPDTRLRFPEVPIGHAHTGGITLRLPAIVGLLRAKELLLTGRWVDASEALRIGLVTEIADDPDTRAAELAAELAAHPRRSTAAAKAALELCAFPGQEAALRLEVEAASYCFAAAEAAETFAAFTASGNVAGAR
jgi:enoyl-CoA hydratase/carnithine racemase